MKPAIIRVLGRTVLGPNKASVPTEASEGAPDATLSLVPTDRTMTSSATVWNTLSLRERVRLPRAALLAFSLTVGAAGSAWAQEPSLGKPSPAPPTDATPAADKETPATQSEAPREPGLYPEPVDEDPPKKSFRHSRWWPTNWFRDEEEDEAMSASNIVRDANGRWRVDTRPRDLPERNPEFIAAQDLFRAEKYDEAARAYKKLAKSYKNKPLEEDALFMYAESLYEAKRFPKAQDKYLELMTKYPTTRYLPQSIQRTYDIAYEWLEDSQLRAQGKPGKYNSFTQYVNFFDRTRPMLDTNGRAIEAIESIQNHDPFGPLTDDAAMMAGAYKFTGGSYLQAAGYYEQLVNDQPKSEHAPRAYFLGSQAYLRAYRGPNYDGVDLESAARLTKAALSRSSELPEEQRSRLEQDMRIIHIERAKRDFRTGEHYLQLRKPAAARMYFQRVIENFSDTDWARRAEEEIAKIDQRAKQPPGLMTRMNTRVRNWFTSEEPEKKIAGSTPATVEESTREVTGVPNADAPADAPSGSSTPAPVSPGKSLGLPSLFKRD
ncbi:MAG: outer membrane protein assembly factor BamD [Planctomycetota bacterium]